jgi:hypothetical protein
MLAPNYPPDKDYREEMGFNVPIEDDLNRHPEKYKKQWRTLVRSGTLGR